VETSSEAGFTIEEVIGPDGRYVLYYRWADVDGSGAEGVGDAAATEATDAADGPAAPVKEPQPDV